MGWPESTGERLALGFQGVCGYSCKELPPEKVLLMLSFTHGSLRQRISFLVVLMLALTTPGGNLTAAEQDSAYAHAAEPIGSVLEIYNGQLPPDLQVNTFRNIQRLFPSRLVKRGNYAHPFVNALDYDANNPLSDFAFTHEGMTYNLSDVLSRNQVAAMMIVKDDDVQFEQYFMGNDEATRWMSMSIAKTITVLMIGVAIQEGAITSLEDPVTQYLPELAGTVYDGVTVEQIIAMTSGVDWNETYTDPASDRRRMLDAQIAQEPGAILTLMGQLARHSPPGTRWNYSTGETHIAGALVHAATGKWLADYASQKLWIPLGMESDATWWLESPDGLEIGGSGLAATLRDYTRIGQFLLHDGVMDGYQLVPAGFIARAGRRTEINGETVNYGYGLWPLHNNSYAANGIFGQYIFVDPDLHMVVTILSAQAQPVNGAGIDEYAFLEALSAYYSQK